MDPPDIPENLVAPGFLYGEDYDSHPSQRIFDSHSGANRTQQGGSGKTQDGRGAEQMNLAPFKASREEIQGVFVEDNADKRNSAKSRPASRGPPTSRFSAGSTRGINYYRHL